MCQCVPTSFSIRKAYRYCVSTILSPIGLAVALCSLAAIAGTIFVPQTVRAQATSPALAIDAEAFGDNSSPSSTAVTSSFSTAKTNELLLAFIATDGPNFHNSGVSGTTYTYRVRARNLAGDSGYASAVCFNGGTTCGGTVTHS